MRQFPRERGFLLVSSLWGCPRRWFRVKQGGSRSSAPEQGIFGEEPDPHPRHLHQTIFHLFKNKRKKMSTLLTPPNWSQKQQLLWGPQRLRWPPPTPTRGFCLLSTSSGICHPIPSPVPASPGASPGHLPPHSCYLIFPLLHESPAKPSHPKATLGTGPGFL